LACDEVFIYKCGAGEGGEYCEGEDRLQCNYLRGGGSAQQYDHDEMIDDRLLCSATMQHEM